MGRPDWRVAGAAGLLVGVTIGGFSLASASSVDRAVDAIELRDAGGAVRPSATPRTDVASVPPASPAPPPAASPETPAPADGTPEVVLPPVIIERASTPTPRPTPAPVPVTDSDSDASVDSDD
jgi:hypothetical protein